MRAATFVSLQRAQSNHSGKLQHIVKLSAVWQRLRSPHIPVINIDILITFQQFLQFGIGLLQFVVVSNNGNVVGHHLAHFIMDAIGVFVAALILQTFIKVDLSFFFLLEYRLAAIISFAIIALRKLDCVRTR